MVDGNLSAPPDKPPALMTPDRSVTAAALPAWNWQCPAEVPATGPLADYARYYGLDRVAPHDAGVRHAMGDLEIAGYRVALQSWRRPDARGTVLLLHGYYDHVGIFDHVIECVLATGHDLLAFDLPGHGLSSGAPASIGDFGEYQAVLRALVDGMRIAAMPQPWYAVAQSTGGAIVMDYLLANRSPPFAGAALLAPLVRPLHWRVNSIVHSVLSPFIGSLERKFATNSHDEQFLQFLRAEDPLQPRLLSVRWVGALKRWIPQLEARAPVDFPLVVVQGDEDGTVDWRHNLAVIREKFPAATIHMVPHGRHQLVNESPEFREPAFAPIRNMLG